jgi:hypothetical protein
MDSGGINGYLADSVGLNKMVDFAAVSKRGPATDGEWICSNIKACSDVPLRRKRKDNVVTASKV